MSTRLILKFLLVAIGFGISMAVSAQDKPPLRLLVGFPPGGSTDTVARLLAEKLRLQLGRPVIVENKPGAGGRLAVQALKSAVPDGTTWMVSPNATMVLQPLLYPQTLLGFDVLTDIAPVANLVSYPLALAVSSKTGVNTAREYVAWVKDNPKEGSFGTAGLGGQTHFSGVQFGKAAGLDLSVVPYRGNGPLVTDLLGGQVPAGVMTAGDIAPHRRGGHVRVIATFGSKRSPLLPDVPTLKEQGYDVDAGEAWTALWTSARTPKAEVDRMQAAVKLVLALPEVRDILIEKQTLQPDFRPAAELGQMLRKDMAYWAPVIKASGFKPEQ